MTTSDRTQTGIRAAVVSIALNSVLGLLKGILGFMTGSIGLLADAAHSLSDAGTSVVLLIGFRIAATPPDPEHPFGHGRAEHVATLVLATCLAIAAFEFGRTSLERFFAPRELSPPLWMLGVLVLTIAAKEFLAFYSSRLARRIDSDALRADAWHHRSDSISTLLVIVGLLGGRLGVRWLDPVAGFGVAVIMALLSYQLIRRSGSTLLGQAPDPEEIKDITRVAGDVKGVLGIHEVIVHRYGVSRWISLHAEVSADLSAAELHAITDEIERRLEGRQWGSVVVHADPVCHKHPLREELLRHVERAVAEDARARAFQDLRLAELGHGQVRVILQLVVEPGMSREDQDRLRRDFATRMRRAFPRVRPSVTTRPSMSGDA